MIDSKVTYFFSIDAHGLLKGGGDKDKKTYSALVQSFIQQIFAIL